MATNEELEQNLEQAVANYSKELEDAEGKAGDRFYDAIGVLIVMHGYDSVKAAAGDIQAEAWGGFKVRQVLKRFIVPKAERKRRKKAKAAGAK